MLDGDRSWCASASEHWQAGSVRLRGDDGLGQHVAAKGRLPASVSCCRERAQSAEWTAGVSRRFEVGASYGCARLRLRASPGRPRRGVAASSDVFKATACGRGIWLRRRVSAMLRFRVAIEARARRPSQVERGAAGRGGSVLRHDGLSVTAA